MALTVTIRIDSNMCSIEGVVPPTSVPRTLRDMPPVRPLSLLLSSFTSSSLLPSPFPSTSVWGSLSPPAKSIPGAHQDDLPRNPHQGYYLNAGMTSLAKISSCSG